MRSLAALLVLASLLWLVYLLSWGKNSYSSFSEAQLETMDAELASEIRDGAGEREAILSMSVSRLLIEEEHARRSRRWPAAGALGVSGLFLLASFWSARRSGQRDEGLRLADSIGNAGSDGSGALSRQDAAALLKISASAPLELVHAAYHAHATAARGRMEGAAPDLRHLSEAHLRRLEQARDVLLRGAKPA